MTPKQVGALLLLSALWGGSFVFMRIAAPALGPVLLIELRVLIAGLALLTYGILSGKLPDPRPHWRHYLVIGAINSALPFVLISTASLYFSASMTATLNATTPLFGAVAASIWIGERLTARKALGLLLGIGGVAALMGLGPIPWTAATLAAAGASLLAAASYGCAAVYTKVKVKGGQPYAISTYSQLFAALLLLPLVPFSLPDQAPSGLVVGSVLALALLSTAVAYLLFFYLILEAGPTRATMVTYLAPAFGMLWGALLLKEPLGIGTLVGFGLILTSVGLVSGSGKEGSPWITQIRHWRRAG